MPLTVFDAVGKFSADTSDLDQFIVKLEQGLSNASEKAAASTQALKAAQDEFRASIRAVSDEGGDTTDNLERLAQAERNLALAAAAAKAEHAALKAELLGTKEASSIAGEATAELTGKLGSMFGLIAAAEGLKMLIEHTQQSVLQLGLLSDKTGIAIETLAGLEHVAEGTGVRFEEVATALIKLSRAQALAIEGGHAQVAAFQRLGISMNEIKSLSPEELFYRIAGAMANAKSHAEQNASAFVLLGRGGAALIPIFNHGTEALRAQIEVAAKASGVTNEARQAAQEWEEQSANFSETIKALLIPAMKLIVPEIKSLEQAGSNWALEFKQIGTIIGGVSVATVEGLKGMGAVLFDILHGNWSTLVTDAKAAEETIAGDFHVTGQQMKQNYSDTTEFIASLWKKTAPFQPQKDDLSDLAAKSKDLTAVVKAQLKEQLANIDAWKSEQHAAYESGALDAAQWAVAELQATHAAGIAHEDYQNKLISIYTRAGDAEKAQAAQLELATLQTENATRETEKLADVHKGLATVAVTAAKLVLDNQLADIETWKAAQLEAYLTGKAGISSWESAQIRATKGAVAAHEAYLKNVVAIYTEQGEAQKAQTAQQQLSTFQIETASKETEKLSEAMKKLTAATKEAKDAEQKLAEDTLSQHYKDQEAAITKLARMHLITERQKDDWLTLLEQQQSNEAIKILDDSLKAQQRLRDEAQAKLDAAKANPSSSSSEITALQTELAKEVAAVAKAEDDKLRLKEKYTKQSDAADKSHYSRALALATAYGKDILAEQLRENHALLLTAQANLADAKARGLDTTAIQHQITALKQSEQALEKEANGNKNAIAAQLQLTKVQLLATQSILADAKARGLDTTAIEKHIAALKQEATELQKTQKATHQLAVEMPNLKDQTKAAAAEMLSSISTAMEGVITGQKSFGKAMEDMTFKMIASMAEQWGAYYAAKGIVDIFDDPPLGAAEIAAAAGLFALAGTLSGLASGSSGSGGGGVQAGPPQAGQGGGNVQLGGGSGSQQNQGITHLAGGGVVTHQIMVGDSESGGDAEEAVVPLENPNALDAISAALMPSLARALAAPANQDRAYPSIPNSLLAPSTMSAASSAMVFPPSAGTPSAGPQESSSDMNDRMDKFADNLESRLSSSSGNGDVHIHMPNLKGVVSPESIKKVFKQAGRMVQNRQLTINATNSLRVTRRSQ